MSGASVSPLLVLGIGNTERGDDAVGREVVRLLRGVLPEHVAVEEQEGEAAALALRLEGVAAAYLVDASLSGAPPGTIRRFDATAAPLPQHEFGLSTHGLGLASAVELARALGQLPPRCIVYAVEGASFERGAGLSPTVADAVARLAKRLAEEIIADGGEREHA